MRRLPATTVFYGLEFLLSMPAWVVISIYLVRTLHLSPLQLVLMGTAMEAAVFVFEVPTGVVADTYSRRLSLVIGFVGMGLAWMLVGIVSSPLFVIVLWAAILSAIRLPDSLLSDRLCKAAALIAVAMLLGSASEKLALRMYEWKLRSTNSWWMVADDLHHLGLDAGDKVATLGSGYNAYWARLGRLKIVAEIQSNDATSFWSSSEHTKSGIFAACERAGAKAMVTREVPSAGPGSSWVKLGGTGYYAHVLEPTGTRNLN